MPILTALLASFHYLASSITATHTSSPSPIDRSSCRQAIQSHCDIKVPGLVFQVAGRICSVIGYQECTKPACPRYLRRLCGQHLSQCYLFVHERWYTYEAGMPPASSILLQKYPNYRSFSVDCAVGCRSVADTSHGCLYRSMYCRKIRTLLSQPFSRWRSRCRSVAIHPMMACTSTSGYVLSSRSCYLNLGQTAPYFDCNITDLCS